MWSILCLIGLGEEFRRYSMELLYFNGQNMISALYVLQKAGMVVYGLYVGMCFLLESVRGVELK